MKIKLFALVAFICFAIEANSQTKITAVNTTATPAPSSFSYSNGSQTYHWGLAPNNTRAIVDGFVAGGNSYDYAVGITGTLKLRRVNNASISGNYTLVWSEAVTSGSTYNLFSEYQNDMEPFFNNRIYNRGTDNFFDNTSVNSNNIERMDWIVSAGYATAKPDKVGFAVFERGASGAHDAFCIAAITSLDGLGNPASYGNIVRISAANYGDPGPNVSYRILKAQYPGNLLDAGSGVQNRGGVLISLQNLGIAANQTIYGYSLLAADLPVSATPANLVDYTNATYFPINTSNSGGIDYIAVTGIFTETSVTPTSFVDFSAIEQHRTVKLTWKVANETSVDRYEVERSNNGIDFTSIAQQKNTNNTTGTNSYTYTDNIPGLISIVYYRIKQYDHDGAAFYSKILPIKLNGNGSEVLVYPNPARDNLYLNIDSDAAGFAAVSVWNASGAQVLSQQFSIVGGSNILTVGGIEKLSSGIYQVHVKLPGGKVFTQPVLKQ